MTYLVVIAFIAIVASLGSALYFMMRRDEGGADARSKSRAMARALALRVGFSILLFVCILLAWKLGYIHPTGIPSSR